jgi:ABC-2 type transport system ATP-binding protein
MVFDSPVDASAFARLPGVSDVHTDGNLVSLRLNDGIDAVIKLAAQHTLLDLQVEHPSLDQVFLGYYDARQPWPV